MGPPQATGALEIPRHQDFDRLLAALIFGSLLLHFGFVFYLHQLDWPRQSDLPDQYWHLMPPRAPPRAAEVPRPAAPGAPARTAQGPGRASGWRRPAAAGRRWAGWRCWRRSAPTASAAS